MQAHVHIVLRGSDFYDHINLVRFGLEIHGLGLETTVRISSSMRSERQIRICLHFVNYHWIDLH